MAMKGVGRSRMVIVQVKSQRSQVKGKTKDNPSILPLTYDL
jgi:hypothetical protein